MKPTLLRPRPARRRGKARCGDIIHVTWAGKGKQRVEVVEGPYMDVYAPECDCAHWAEIIDAMGGENII